MSKSKLKIRPLPPTIINGRFNDLWAAYARRASRKEVA